MNAANRIGGRRGTRSARRARAARAAALVLAGLLVATPAAAQEEVVEETTGGVLSAAAGGVIGLVAGGYGNLAVVVMKTRFGRYPHSFRDAFGWESIPILTGAGTGVVLGYLSSDLLIPWVIAGAGGFGAGAGLGYLYGLTIWGDPESRWANAAVGAAVGMTIGSTVAIIREFRPDGSNGESAMTGATSGIRIPLVEIRF